MRCFIRNDQADDESPVGHFPSLGNRARRNLMDDATDLYVVACVCLQPPSCIVGSSWIIEREEEGAAAVKLRDGLSLPTHTDNTTINSFVWLLRSFEMTDYRFDIHARPSASWKWENKVEKHGPDEPVKDHFSLTDINYQCALANVEDESYFATPFFWIFQ